MTTNQLNCEAQPAAPIVASIMCDDGGDVPAFCLMVAYRSENDAKTALAMLTTALAQPASEPGKAYAALPEPIGAAHIHESGELISAHSIRFHVVHNDDGDFDDHDTKIYTADQMRAFADATHALRASRGQAPAGALDAYGAACYLATTLFEKHFRREPDYASGRVVGGPCDTTAGVISQIDNMVSGLVRPDAGVLEDAARDVLAERQRQISAEGWTPEHDDEHYLGELSQAAACYASQAFGHYRISAFWPWAAKWWKPSLDPRRNLEKAGALILAEMERIDRAAYKQGGA